MSAYEFRLSQVLHQRFEPIGVMGMEVMSWKPDSGAGNGRKPQMTPMVQQWMMTQAARKFAAKKAAKT